MPPVRASELELSKAPSAAEDLGSESAFDEVRSRAAEARSWASAAPDAEEFLRSLDLHSGLGRHFGGGVSPDVYELVTQMRLIACQSGAVPRVRAFCAGCDAAGTVAAVNHYVRSMCPGTGFEWVVGALGRPADCAGTEHEIPEARGAETGAAVALLADAVHARFGGSGSSGATLYVASGDPGRGPGDTLALTQTLTGVLALAPGGHLVSSAPALTTSFSRSLVALVAALFDEVYVAKPLASLPTNGTVYLVGKGFHGISAPLAESLLARLGALARGPPPAGGWPPLIEPTLCASVDGALLRVARQVYGRQQATFLAEAGSYYAQYQGRLGALSSALAPDARRAEEVWLASNPVRALQEGFWLWP